MTRVQSADSKGMINIPNRFALGGSLFGWTLNKTESFQVLDHFYFDMGQNIIDTADSYAQWKPGNQGGESESIIGDWIRSRKIQREKIFLITKIGQKKDRAGFNFEVFQKAIKESLRRLQTDYVDLLFIHHPPPSIENLQELTETTNKISKFNFFHRLGLSNFSLYQIQTFLSYASKSGNTEIFAIQNHYNLIERDSKIFFFDDYSKRTNRAMSSEILPWAINNGTYVFAYHALCRGVLTNEFLKLQGIREKSIHFERTKKYAVPLIFSFLSKVHNVSLKYGSNISEVALSWLRMEYANTIPVVSCNSISQLDHLKQQILISSDEFSYLDFLGHQQKFLFG